MTHNQDYVYYDSGLMLNSKQPMKQIDVCLVSTKDYVFYIPKKSVGMFLVLNTIKTHQYFDGVSIEEGVKKIISESATLQDLEKSLIAIRRR